MIIKSTGNETVDKMLGISITGNVIPQQWYSSIVRDNGKPYLAAIVILADIVYWYKPVEIRDELTGQIKEYRKKFAKDKLQRSYQQIADMFGISKREATNAIVFLEKLGVIKRDLRTIKVNGMVCTNVLFIDLIPEKLIELTHLSPNKVTPLTFKSDTPHVEKGEVYTQSGGTYTENTTKISTKTLNNIKKEREPEKSAENTLPTFDGLIDSYTDNEELRFELKEYLKIRKFKNIATTNRAIELSLNELDKFSNSDEEKIRVVKTAIMKGCVTFYPLKDYENESKWKTRDENTSYDLDEYERQYMYL